MMSPSTCVNVCVLICHCVLCRQSVDTCIINGVFTGSAPGDRRCNGAQDEQVNEQQTQHAERSGAHEQTTSPQYTPVIHFLPSPSSLCFISFHLHA